MGAMLLIRDQVTQNIAPMGRSYEKPCIAATELKDTSCPSPHKKPCNA